MRKCCVATTIIANVILNYLLFFVTGYAFLLFQDERSVQALIDACIKEEDKLYLCVSSPTIKDKPVSTHSIVQSVHCIMQNIMYVHVGWFTIKEGV